MKRNLRLIYVAFAVSLVILIALSFVFYQRFRGLIKFSNQVDHTYRVINQLNELENYIKDAETGQRGYFLTGDSTFLQPYLEFSGNIRPTLANLEKLIGDNESEKRSLVSLKYYTYVKLAYLDNNQLASPHDRNLGWFRKRLREGKLYMDSIRTKVTTMEDEEYRLLHIRDRSKAFFLSVVPAYFGTIFLFALVVFVISFILVLRQFKRRLRYQRELEQKVFELNTRNSELEEIAFVASHDLQEPMRKIRTFADRLTLKHQLLLDEDARQTVGRMDGAATRMQGLIEDLVDYASLTTNPEKLETVDLNETLKLVANEFRDAILSGGGRMEVGEMPVLRGYSHQLYLLFRELIDNALKFARKDRPINISVRLEMPDIKEIKAIAGRKERGPFCKIIVEDNGIGFSNEFARKIFMIFQRLHSQVSEYAGKGIGLAIVRRVMSNHSGYVTARSEEGAGACFELFFPVESIYGANGKSAREGSAKVSDG